MATRSIKLLGDKLAASKLTKYALHHEEILNTDMSFQSLSVSRREIQFLDGVIIVLSRTHNHTDISIEVPPDVSLPEKLVGIPVTIYNFSGEICLDCDRDMAGGAAAKFSYCTINAKNKATPPLENYELAFEKHGDGYQRPGFSNCSDERHYIDWRSKPDDQGNIDVIVYAGPKARYGSCWVWEYYSSAYAKQPWPIYMSPYMIINGTSVYARPDIYETAKVVGCCFRFVAGVKKLTIIVPRRIEKNHLTEAQAEAWSFDREDLFEYYILQATWDYTATELESAIGIYGTYDADTNPRGWELFDKMHFETVYGGAKGSTYQYDDEYTTLLGFCYFNAAGTKFVGRVGGSETFRECTLGEVGITTKKFIDGRYWGRLHTVSQFGTPTAADDGFLDPVVVQNDSGMFCDVGDFYEVRQQLSDVEQIIEAGSVAAMDYQYPSDTLVALVSQGYETSYHKVITTTCTNMPECCHDSGVSCETTLYINEIKRFRSGAFFVDLLGRKTPIFSYDVVTEYVRDSDGENIYTTVENVSGITLSNSVMSDPLEHAGTGFNNDLYNPGHVCGALRESYFGTSEPAGTICIRSKGNAQLPWADIRAKLVLVNFALWEYSYDISLGAAGRVSNGHYYGMMMKQGRSILYKKVFYYAPAEPIKVLFYATLDNGKFEAGVQKRYGKRQTSELDFSGSFGAEYAFPASFAWIAGSLVIGQAAGMAPWAGYVDGCDSLAEVRFTGDNKKRFLTKVLPESLDDQLDSYREDDGSEEGLQLYQSDTVLFRRCNLIRAKVKKYNERIV